MKTMIEKLKDIKNEGSVNPSSVWVSENKRVLMSKIQADANKNKTVIKIISSDKVGSMWQGMQIFMPARTAVAFRSLLIAFSVVGLTVGSVSASQNSLPGDLLYPVRWAKEEAHVALSPNKEEKVKRLLDQAGARVEEINKAKSPKQGAQVTAVLNKKIETVNEILKKESSAPEASKIAQVVEKGTEEILVSLKSEEKEVVEKAGSNDMGDKAETDNTSKSEDINENVYAGVDTDAEKLVKGVEQAIDLIEETTVQAVVVLIEKEHEEGENPNVDVNQLVQNKLDRLASDLVDIQERVDAAEKMVGTTTTPNADPYVMVSTTIVIPGGSASSDTSRIDESLTVQDGSVNSVAPSIAEGVKEVQKKVEQAGEKIAEAKTLVQENNLLGALEKVKEVTDIKKETKTVATDVKKVADKFISDEVIKKETVAASIISGSSTTLSIDTSTFFSLDKVVGTQ